ncbi:hypothetical protein [Arachnia propionica]|uniref:hypothetical protein n=1 Tax=Arachnia propionica TaxID=1750 RepID=UPI0016398DE7|nr:hypothetical protein [Arachnia propionica]
MSFVPTISRLALCSAVAVALSTALPAASHADEAATSEYILTLLQPADGHLVAAAQGINDNGDITGITRPQTAAQPQQAALWPTGTQQAIALPQLPDSRFGRGFDLSASSLVAGEAFDAQGSSIPAAWTRDSVTQLPSVSPNGRGLAVDIAEDGQILGNANNGTMGVAYLITGETVTTLTAPATDEGTLTRYRAVAISPDGARVTGISNVDVPHGDHHHAESLLTVWHNGKPTMWEPEDHGPAFTPSNIDNSGLVVGSVKPQKHVQAATWVDGRLTLLTDPNLGEYPHVTANASNGAGLIIGTATKYAGNSSFGGAAVAWREGVPVDLNTLVDLPENVTLQDARDINASGQIVGTARTDKGSVGFLLTPRKAPNPQPTPTQSPSAAPSPSTAPSATTAPTAAPTTAPTATATASTPAPSQVPSKPVEQPRRPGLPRTGH